MLSSRYMPCRHCGASLERSERETHECSPERLLDYTMFSLREEIAGFEPTLRAHLDTPSGRFEAWEAARQVRGLPG